MNGVIILDKPPEFTSFDAVAVMRRISKERKIGHTGTLDPMATGVLPLLLGRAAKAADLLEDTDKEYEAAFQFGEQTDTGDRTGTQTNTGKKDIPQGDVVEALSAFRGNIFQIPPMYSAVSINGQRLYKLARKGIEIPREKRPVHIACLELLSYEEAAGAGVLKVACSKGTYIRTLIEDIAHSVGTCGVMTALRRTAACGFSQEEAVSLKALQALGEEGMLLSVLRPVDTLFSMYTPVFTSEAQAARFQNGGSLDLSRLSLPRIALQEGQRICVYSPGKTFLGLGTVSLSRNECRLLKLFLLPGETG